MKNSMTSLDLSAILTEIGHRLNNSRLINVYQPAPQLLILKLRTQAAENLHLLLEAGRRLHLTNLRFRNPAVPSAFCTILRKYLRNSLLTEISQYDLDRLAILDLKRGPITYKLIAELLDRGNITLTDAELTILASSARKGKVNRPMERGATYVFPQARGLNILEATPDQAHQLMQKSKSDIVRTLVRYLNVPGEAAEEVCIRAGIRKEIPATSITPQQVASLLEEARKLASETKEEASQAVILRSGSNLQTVLPRRLQVYEGFDAEEFSDFSSALERYFDEANLISRVKSEEDALARWQHVIDEQKESLEKLKKDAEQHRAIGSLLFADLRHAEQLLQTLNVEKQRTGHWQEAVERLREMPPKSLSGFRIDSFDPIEGRITVTFSGSQFELDVSKGAAANASDYYQKAKEAEAKAERALAAIEETKSKLRSATDLAERSRPAESRTIPRQHWYERFRWFISSGGCLGVGGRDASQNETLIKKHLEPADLVVHADVQGAPFVIVKPNQSSIGEPSVDEAARFAVSYSSAWRGGLGSADAYWVKPEQVSKKAPSGEFLGKGAFMITGQKNYRRGIPLELSVGVSREDGLPKIIAGPEKAVKSRAEARIEIIPGEIPAEKFAPQLRFRLTQLLKDDIARIVKSLDSSEFMRVLPSGGCRFKQSKILSEAQSKHSI